MAATSENENKKDDETMIDGETFDTDMIVRMRTQSSNFEPTEDSGDFW